MDLEVRGKEPLHDVCWDPMSFPGAIPGHRNITDVGRTLRSPGLGSLHGGECTEAMFTIHQVRKMMLRWWPGHGDVHIKQGQFIFPWPVLG